MLFPKTTLILVADDTSTMRNYVKTALLSLGYENVVEAADGTQALLTLDRAFKAGRPVGLVLSDWNMPEMTGLELLTQIRNHPVYNELPFVLVTSKGCESEILEALQQGADGFIIKPFSEATLLMNLRDAYRAMIQTRRPKKAG